MKIKPCMGVVEYDFEKPSRTKIIRTNGNRKTYYEFPIKSIKNIDYEGVSIKNNRFYTKTHYRSYQAIEISQFCFRVEDAEQYKEDNLEFKIEDGFPFEYSEEHGLYFQKAYFEKINQNYEYSKRKEVQGISAAGHFTVKAYYNGVLVYESPLVVVLPSSLTIDEYETMISDLFSIHNKLILNSFASALSMGAKKNGGISGAVDYFFKLLEDLKPIIEKIDKRPHVQISKTIVRKPSNKIKKFTPKTIISLSANPYGKITTYDYEENTDIYEHRVLYQVFKSIKLYIESINPEEIYAEVRPKDDNRDDIRLIINKDNGISRDESAKFLETKREEIIEEKSVKRDELKKTISNCKNLINEILGADIFKHINKNKVEVLRPTPIFIKDSLYNICWEKINNLSEPIVKLENSKDFINNIADTCSVYEYWCLYKMIEILFELGWEFADGQNGQNPLNDLKKSFRTFINDNGKLEGFTLPLKKEINFIDKKSEEVKWENKEISFLLKFNCEISAEDKKRPDYTFEITDGNGRIHKFYLDAKYRDYRNISSFYNDIRDVAITKYLLSDEKFMRTKADASFILHSCDNEYGKNPLYGGSFPKNFFDNCSDEIEKIYSGKNKPNHEFGGVCFKPNHTDDFRQLLKVIFEYHCHFYFTCWDCGSINTKVIKGKTAGDNTKYYCRCESPNCKKNDYWAKTNCKGSGKHTIIKHTNPYHELRSGGKGLSGNYVCAACEDSL